MGIPRKKHRFLKPLLPGFKNGINVPRNFLRFLKGTNNRKAVLKTGGRKWHVELSLGKFEDAGWKSFCIDNDLQVGDFAVFKHEGNMVFKVLLFDPSACEKVHSTNVVKVEPMETEETKEESSYSVSSSEYLQSKVLKRGPKESPVAETVSSREHPHFVSFIKPFNLKYPYLNVPRVFAKQNKLLKKYCKMNLVDDLQRSWPVVLRGHSSHVHLGSGWVKFREANGLKVGDCFKFEIVKTGKTPVVNLEEKTGHKTSPSVFAPENCGESYVFSVVAN